MLKLGVAATGSVVHCVKVPDEAGATEYKPVCQYRQGVSSDKASIGKGNLITTTNGKEAAAEAITWTMVKGHLSICKRWAPSIGGPSI